MHHAAEGEEQGEGSLQPREARPAVGQLPGEAVVHGHHCCSSEAPCGCQRCKFVRRLFSAALELLRAGRGPGAELLTHCSSTWLGSSALVAADAQARRQLVTVSKHYASQSPLDSSVQDSEGAQVAYTAAIAV